MSIIKFPFQKKEGKFFAPIVSQETTYKVSGGAVVADATQLIAGGNIYGEYNWTPIDFLDDPTVYNPIASPPIALVAKAGG